MEPGVEEFIQRIACLTRYQDSNAMQMRHKYWFCSTG